MGAVGGQHRGGLGRVAGGEGRTPTAVRVGVDEPGHEGAGEVPVGRRRRGAPAGAGDPVAVGLHPARLDRAGREHDAVSGEQHLRSPSRRVGPGVGRVSGVRIAGGVTASSSSSSRPGVRRFHLRITHRNSR